MQRQPNVLVKEVLSDLYGFRNAIAHGQDIPKTPYRQKVHLVSTMGERINPDDYDYGDLMAESALFILTSAIRRIFVENLVDAVKDGGDWRARMKTYEHRYKDAGGPAAVKQRGR
jgi:hypothetical protein